MPAPTLRTDHAAAQAILVNMTQVRAVTLRQFQRATKAAGIRPSTFAVWNAVNAGLIKRIGHGIYQRGSEQ